MRVYGIALIILIGFSSISAWGDVKSKQEISSKQNLKPLTYLHSNLPITNQQKKISSFWIFAPKQNMRPGIFGGRNGFLEGNWSTTFKKS